MVPLPWPPVFKLAIVGLVTFRRNKYMTVRTFKLGSRTRKKRKWDVLIQPRKYFQYFVDLRKVYFRSFLHLFYVYFCVLRVNMGSFGCFPSKWVMFMVQKTQLPHGIRSWKFQNKFLFHLKTSNPVSNSLQYIHCNRDLIKTIYHESWDCKLMRHEIKILSYQK